MSSLENVRDYYRRMGRPQNIPSQQLDECESIEENDFEINNKM